MSTRDQKIRTVQSGGQEPGLLESYGSFPVWLLKIIQMLTPDFLNDLLAPKKEKSTETGKKES